MIDEVYACYSDATSRLEKLPLLKGKVIEVFDKESFVSVISNKNSPCAGVLYENSTRAVQNTQAQGRIVNMYIAILLYSGDTCKDQKGQIDRKKLFSLLNEMRSCFKEKSNPGGRKWSFESETPILVKEGGYLLYHQRWSTRLALTD